MNQKTILDILKMKNENKIAMLTAYDYPMAAMLDEAGADILLVGDSVANVVYGMKNTLSIPLEIMAYHARAVSSAVKRALVVCDLPFGSYQPSIGTAVKNAAKLLSEGRVHAVKLEGGTHMAPTVKKLVDVGIPVMGHVGLTPQSVHQLGGYRIQGKTNYEVKKIFEDAKSLEKAGAFAIVLECVEPALAENITKELSIPTIGIGSGEQCDGQVLVTHDLMGFTVSPIPKFVNTMVNLRSIVTETAQKYVHKVKQ